jgi:hypothetical protein
MTAGVSVFLGAAAPTGGSPHAPAASWWLAGLFTALAVAVTVAAVQRRPPVPRAAGLGIASGIAWGFVAAVIKELSSRIAAGPAAIFGSWPVYVLMAAGAAAMLLASHAMAAGPLAASQPGFTIGDPVVAILLGVFLFDERLDASPGALAAQVAGLLVLALGVWTLSESRLITQARPAPPEPRPGEDAGQELASGSC